MNPETILPLPFFLTRYLCENTQLIYDNYWVDKVTGEPQVFRAILPLKQDGDVVQIVQGKLVRHDETTITIIGDASEGEFESHFYIYGQIPIMRLDEFVALFTYSTEYIKKQIKAGNPKAVLIKSRLEEIREMMSIDDELLWNMIVDDIVYGNIKILGHIPES